MHQRRVSVAIVGDYDIVERGLADSLDGHPQLHLVGRIAETGPAGTEPIDLVLLDPYGRSDVATRVVGALVRHPLVRHVALFSLDLPAPLVADARRLGVRAVIPKSLGHESLVRALLEAAAGQVVDATGAGGAPPPRTWPGREDGLSERESEVLLLCGEGLSNREIADALYLSLETVKTHLKNVYARLGLRNRAQATSYLHRSGSFPRLRPEHWSQDGSPSPGGDVLRGVVPADSPEPPLVDQLGLTDRRIGERLALLGLTPAARARLSPYAAAVERTAGATIDRLYERLRAEGTTAPFLADERTVARLREAQLAYAAELVAAPFDRRHVERVLRIGAVHHRIRLAPQWYLASCVHLLCDHVAAVVDAAPSPADALDACGVLIASAMFDIGLVLDAYELSLTREVADEHPSGATRDVLGVERRPGDDPGPADDPPRRPLARVTLTPDEVDVRRRFVGLDDDVIAALHDLGPAVEDAVGAVLDGFYALVRASPTTADLVPADRVPHLLRQVGAHWTAMATSRFDRAHTAACMRVGVIHERIGVTPPDYLTGLAQQLTALMRAVVRPGPGLRRDVDALVRAVLFDATFVIDAYLEARIDTLLQTGRYADQLVSGLASGVAVVDERGRVEHANAQLLRMVATPAGLLRRMPVESALPFAGIGALVAQARQAPSGRATATVRAGGRHLRLAAIALRPTIGSAAGLVAVVVDDVSDVLHADEVVAREGRTLDHVLAAVEAVVWELDADTHTVVAMGRAVEQLTGARDVDLLGGPGLVDLVHPDDRRAFTDACTTASGGVRVQLDHRLRHADGGDRTVRSSLVARLDAHGVRTICGVTVRLEAVADGPTTSPPG